VSATDFGEGSRDLVTSPQTPLMPKSCNLTLKARCGRSQGGVVLHPTRCLQWKSPPYAPMSVFRRRHPDQGVYSQRLKKTCSAAFHYQTAADAPRHRRKSRLRRRAALYLRPRIIRAIGRPSRFRRRPLRSARRPLRARSRLHHRHPQLAQSALTRAKSTSFRGKHPRRSSQAPHRGRCPAVASNSSTNSASSPIAPRNRR